MTSTQSYAPAKNRFDRMKRRFIKEKQLWIVCIPLIIWVIIFAYIPMLGISIAFLDYYPGMALLDCNFVGLKHFEAFFLSSDFPRILRNTLAISGLNLFFGFPAPIILALLLSELNNRYFKKFVQTVSYLPHFLSWVVVSSILFTFLGNEGLINHLLVSLGITENVIPFLAKGEYFWPLITIANIWKSSGWNAIIYLSAIAGIDQNLYEAGAIDGLGRLGAVWHITLPQIKTTIVLLFILGVSGLLNAGFEQQLLIGNSLTMEYHDVIDTYAYRFGIQQGNFSYATAVSLAKSVIGFSLVWAANMVSRKTLDASIF